MAPSCRLSKLGICLFCKHDYYVCRDIIQPGKEYYQLILEQGFSGFITKHICEHCWYGKELKACRVLFYVAFTVAQLQKAFIALK